MTSPRYDRLAADLLGRVKSEPTEATAEERSAAIVAMEAAIRRKQRQKKLVRASSLLAMAASIAVASFVAWRARVPAKPHDMIAVVAQPIGSGATLTELGEERALSAETSLERASRVVAREDGGATFKLSTGTILALEPLADVTVLERGQAQRFALAAGALRADVAKLTEGQRFVVMTLDAEVEVRGTSFRVAVIPPGTVCDASVRTKVDVFEGVVRVRGNGKETAVHAGESWPECKSATPSEETEEARAPIEEKSAADRFVEKRLSSVRAKIDEKETPRVEESIEKAVEDTPEIEKERSNLAEQNELFARASLAEQRGDHASARVGYEALLAGYPEGPLAESAEVELMRVLRKTDRALARAFAERYLNRHPNGSARREAEEVRSERP